MNTFYWNRKSDLQKLEQETEEKNAEIPAQNKEILRLNVFLNIDANNSGIPNKATTSH